MPILSKYSLDIPNQRSSHFKSKPTGAGIIFSTYSFIFGLFSNNFILLISYPLALVGFLDDKFKLSSITRYVCQFLSVVSLILYFLVQNQTNTFMDINYFSYFYIFIILIVVILGTAVINFINFIDGIDGLMGGCMFVIFFTFSIKNNPSLLPLCGSILGFLIWNWHPSRIFMGDCGSIFLGCVFYGEILNSKSFYEFLLGLNLLSPILIDGVSCLFRRFFSGDNIFKPHNKHLYQRLFQAGISPKYISSIYISSTALLCLSYFYSNLTLGLLITLFIFITGLWLNKNKAVPFVEY